MAHSRFQRKNNAAQVAANIARKTKAFKPTDVPREMKRQLTHALWQMGYESCFMFRNRFVARGVVEVVWVRDMFPHTVPDEIQTLTFGKVKVKYTKAGKRDFPIRKISRWFPNPSAEELSTGFKLTPVGFANKPWSWAA